MDVFEAAADARRRRLAFAIATVIHTGGSTPRGAGARLLLTADGTLHGTVGGGALEHAVHEAARRALVQRAGQRVEVVLDRDLGMCCGGRVEVYVDYVEARPRLWIWGAGHVAAAAAPIAVALDFDVVVVDGRDAYAVPERFPGAHVRCEDPVASALALPDGPSDWHLVVTHDHAADQAIAGHLLSRSAAWIGLIGSRAKVARFRTRWAEEGRDPATFERLSAPVGLDIGAETPAEIAVAVAAEWVQVRRRADHASSNSRIAARR
jgi:xanthine dehydrogenase accessory factor